MKSISELMNQLGVVESEAVPNAKAWLLLNRIRSEGGLAMIKLDGQRDEAVYTIVVSGGSLGKEYFRKDGDDLELLITEAANFYDNLVWSAPASDSPSSTPRD